MKRVAMGLLFVAACAAQWAVPAAMVQRELDARAHGAVYRFRTAPVDPADPFRGRYVALDYAASCAPGLLDGSADDERVWVVLGTDADGFAEVREVSAVRPASGDYLQARVLRWGCENGRRLRYRFDRYYLPEELAPQAEKAYLELSRRARSDENPRLPAWAEVRVRDGYGALVELYLDGAPVREYLAGLSSAPATP